jgi:hypothetical protein
MCGRTATTRTRGRAAEAAAKTAVKKITVIGTLVGKTMIKDAEFFPFCHISLPEFSAF